MSLRADRDLQLQADRLVRELLDKRGNRKAIGINFAFTIKFNKSQRAAAFGSFIIRHRSEAGEMEINLCARLIELCSKLTFCIRDLHGEAESGDGLVNFVRKSLSNAIENTPKLVDIPFEL